jgi:cobyrinic acid a,c-diamide synthase
MSAKFPKGLVIAGPQSGVGKTTVTLALIAAARRRGMRVQAFKVGPDFIDPGHLTKAAGRACHNLDGWMLTRETNREIFFRSARNAELVVVEGVMGLFDGYDGLSEAGSTAQMAKWLKLPVVLVVDARSQARSAAALIHGFATFDPELPLAGVIFNRIGSPRHLDYLRQALEKSGEVPCFGGLPRESEISLPERHLGLVTAEDHPLDATDLEHLAVWLEGGVDLDRLLEALPPLALKEVPEPVPLAPQVRLGVAKDPAFCFYYQENLEWLARFGAEIVDFSPLSDRKLPEVYGLYLGGGYPELYARQLSDNQAMLQAVREAALAGLPIYAECGALMYLSREVQDLAGNRYPLAGVLPFEVRMLQRLKALGYREVTLAADTLLGPAGLRVRGHEFHYSEIVGECGETALVYDLTPRPGTPPRKEGFQVGQVLASYVHLHFGSNPEVARQFVARCRRYKETRE